MKIIKKALKKCCSRTQAGKPAGVERDGASVPGYCLMNRCMNGSPPHTFAISHHDDQQQKADREQPQQVEPHRRPTSRTRKRFRFTRRTEPAQVAVSITSSARRQLVSVAANDVRGHARPLSSTQILRRSKDFGVESPKAYAAKTAPPTAPRTHGTSARTCEYEPPRTWAPTRAGLERGGAARDVPGRALAPVAE